ncbi:MAG: biotin--[acetyl-CoA-carboxylase] ligase [Pseudomonadota bacterium]
MDRLRVIELLQTAKPDGFVRAYRSIDSTNNEAKRILAGEDGERVIIAESQTGGRGRASNTWHSPPGANLYFSLVLDLGNIEEKDAGLLSIVFGVALHGAIAPLVSGKLSLKWPNDLYLEGKKLAGILSEVTAGPKGGKFVIAGMGVNVNTRQFPPGLRASATSLLIEEKKQFAREELLAAIVSRTAAAAARFREHGFAPFPGEFRKRCSLWGRKVRVDGRRGMMKDISAGGGLVLELDDGSTEEIFSGSVELI